jgi:hypothetical protein
MEQATTLLICICEVLGSNIGQETYLLFFYMVFLSPCNEIPEEYLILGHDRFLLHSFPLNLTCDFGYKCICLYAKDMFL